MCRRDCWRLLADRVRVCVRARPLCLMRATSEHRRRRRRRRKLASALSISRQLVDDGRPLDDDGVLAALPYLLTSLPPVMARVDVLLDHGCETHTTHARNTPNTAFRQRVCVDCVQSHPSASPDVYWCLESCSNAK